MQALFYGILNFLEKCAKIGLRSSVCCPEIFRGRGESPGGGGTVIFGARWPRLGNVVAIKRYY